MSGLPGIFWIVPAAGVITIIFAAFLVMNVMKRPRGTPKMKEIGDIIFQGPWAFLKRQYSTISMYSVAIAIIIGVLVGILGGTEVEGMSKLSIGWHTGLAFLIGVTVIFFAFGGNNNPEIAPHLIVGFGFGASFVALFAQLGGGIYTKAADMGADLVGKVEAGIPEDDPRNAAVIADLVGDNVGDCAGRGADLFESTAAENIGAMILGIIASPAET